MSDARTYQLPDGDAIFLSMEAPNALGHVGSIGVLDPSTRPDLGFDALAAHIEARIERVPRFTWKLQEVTLGLDRPYWVPDPAFRVGNHVRRAAIPSPGTLRELHELVGRLHAQPLDRSRPLWEIVLIEGLADGRVGLYIKIHHCLMDGASGTGLADVLADLTPDADGPLLVPDAYQEEPPKAPGSLRVTANAVANHFRRGRRVGHHLGRAATALGRSLLRRDGSPSVPRLYFNQNPSRRRALATVSLPLESVKSLRKHFDVKLNDVMLELVGSAMRRFLAERGELPEEPLVAMCPVSTRDASDVKLDNQLTSMAVPLATDCVDPVERLGRIAQHATRAKEDVARGGFDYLAALGETLAPGLVTLSIAAAELAGDASPLPANFVVSNVRGTPMPLYFAGARVDSIMPMSMLAMGQCLNVTVVSYMDKIDVGITYDPDRVPDAERLAEGMLQALEELESAAEGVVHRAA